MSGYDSAVIGLEITEHPDVLEMPDRVWRLFIEAIVWSRGHQTDGEITRAALRRLTAIEDPEEAAGQLVTAGRWEASDRGWQIVGFAAELGQDNREKVQKRRQQNADRLERFHARHGKRNALPNALTNGSDRPTDRPTGRGSREKGGVAAGQEAAAALEVIQLSPGAADTVDCSDYLGHQWSHRHFQEGWRCDLCDRRRLAASIREASPVSKPRLLRAWHSSYGHLYGKQATL